jgi:hypothetical protein
MQLTGPPEANGTLTERTKIPLSLVITLAPLLWWASSQHAKLNHLALKIEDLTHQLQATEAKIDTLSAIIQSRQSKTN